MKKYAALYMIITIIFLFAAVFTYFMNGILDWKSILFTVISGLFVIFWIISNNDVLKNTVRSRSLKYSSNAIVFAFLIGSIFISLYYIVYTNNKEIDVTKNKIFSFSEQTINILKNLKSEIKVYAVFDENSVSRKIGFEDFIKRYGLYSKKIKYQIINPYKEPKLMENLGLNEIGAILFVNDKNRKKVSKIDEETFTNAIKSVSSSQKKKIYFIVSHGEKKIDSIKRDSLALISEKIKNDNYDIETIEMIRLSKIPSDASLIVIPGPEKEYTEIEKTVLKNYLNNGGRILFMVDPGGYIMNDIFAQYGIEVKNYPIIDINPLSSMLKTNRLTPAITKYARHEITKDFGYALIMNIAAPVNAIEKEGYRSRELAFTQPNSWAETEFEKIDQNESIEKAFDENDIKGPIPVFAISEKEKENDSQEERTSMIAVFGDSDFISNAYVNMQGNSDFILNTINYLSGNEDFIGIRPKEASNQPLQFTEGMIQGYFFLYYLVIPSIPIIFFFFMKIMRRVKDE